MAYSKLTLERKMNGFCIDCGKLRENNGILRCKDCSITHNEKSKRVAIYRKEKKLCATCGEKLRDLSKTTCKNCRKKAKERYKEFSKERKELGMLRYSNLKLERRKTGLCMNCGKLKEKSNTFLCIKCNIKNNEGTKQTTKKRKEQKRCISCGKKLRNLNFVFCKKCRKIRSKDKLVLQKLRKEKDLCAHCGVPATIGKKHRVCEKCWFKNIARTNLGSTKYWKDIKNLLIQQKYKCAYTGKKLIIGENASLDHIIPRCQNGDNSISNVQWLEKHINSNVKFGMSHNEFISFIKNILKNVENKER